MSGGCGPVVRRRDSPAFLSRARALLFASEGAARHGCLGPCVARQAARVAARRLASARRQEQVNHHCTSQAQNTTLGSTAVRVESFFC